MARRYYRRRTVTVRPKKKWATNFLQGTLTNSSASTSTAVLVQNSSQTTAPTPVIVKAGNFKFQGDLSINYSSAQTTTPRIAIFIFFLPQGLDLSADTANGIVQSHPEWILAWKQLDSSVASANTNASMSAFSFSSRLKRNLNSGDRICVGFTQNTTGSIITIQYSAQYWTCAN